VHMKFEIFYIYFFYSKFLLSYMTLNTDSHLPMHPNLKIQNLKQFPDYIPQLAKWHENEWGHYYPDQSLEDREAMMRFYLYESLIPSTYIALDGEYLLGSAAIIESDMPEKPNLSPWLASVFVRPEARNQGVASRLVRHICSQAKIEGIAKLYLFTANQQGFYHKLGWQVLSHETYADELVTVMELVL